MKILILKASSDETMRKLLDGSDGAMHGDIDCLIQSSQIERYRMAYPDINFIDICRERFEDVPPGVIAALSRKRYDQLYVTLTRENAQDFWNVIEVVSRMRFKKGAFYNCNGERIAIPRKDLVKDALCGLYIKWIGRVY